MDLGASFYARSIREQIPSKAGSALVRRKPASFKTLSRKLLIACQSARMSGWAVTLPWRTCTPCVQKTCGFSACRTPTLVGFVPASRQGKKLHNKWKHRRNKRQRHHRGCRARDLKGPAAPEKALGVPGGGPPAGKKNQPEPKGLGRPSDRCHGNTRGTRGGLLNRLNVGLIGPYIWRHLPKCRKTIPPEWFIALYGATRYTFHVPLSTLKEYQKTMYWTVRVAWALYSAEVPHTRKGAWGEAHLAGLHTGRAPTFVGAAAVLRTVARRMLGSPFVLRPLLVTKYKSRF